MASSRAASCLRISVFHRRFASVTELLYLILILGIVDITSLLDSLKINLPIVLILFFCILRAVVKDLKDLDSHEWINVEGNSDTVSITNHAQDYLGDVVC
ncbi:glycine cleavage system h protein 2 [Quercus suber]|uniref:Glycine cleavage system h protein 2 n=1 Tax=Quercus suber TaxID=58331 RepID=A0AAW0ILN0_QUESU